MSCSNDVPVDLARADPEVNRVARVPDQYFRRLDGGQSVHRLILREPREPGCSTPNRLVEIAIDRDDGIDARDIDMHPFCATVVYRRVLKQGDSDKERQQEFIPTACV